MKRKYMLTPKSLNFLEVHISVEGHTRHVESFTRNLTAGGNRIGESETDAQLCYRARAWAQEYLHSLRTAEEELAQFKDICQHGTWFDETGPTSFAD